jgi:hypothetical protein
MSLPLTPTGEDDRTVTVVTRAVIPMLVAAAVTALVLVAVRAEPFAAAAEYGAAPPPTPYSEMHAGIEQAPGGPDEPAPTF